MSTLQMLSYKQNEVRMVMQDDGPWWVLKDVCEILELKQSHRVAARLDDDEKGGTFLTTPGGDQEMTIINESGLYSVILRSNKPEAKAFKRWITHEVLPSIRRTGGYQTPISEAELLVRLAQANLAQEQRISALERRVDLSVSPVTKTSLPACAVLPSPSSWNNFLSSLDIAQILGRSHNQVLRRIRNVLKYAEIDGIIVQDHIQTAYRRGKNNARQIYYQLDLEGVQLFGQSILNKELVKKMESMLAKCE